MKSTKVKTHVLLKKVTENREAHQKAHREASQGHRRQLLDALETGAEALKGGRIDGEQKAAIIELLHGEPADHTKDYDRVIAMLEMSTEDEVTLDARDFGRYALDDWEWKEAFLASTRNYSDH